MRLGEAPLLGIGIIMQKHGIPTLRVVLAASCFFWLADAAKTGESEAFPTRSRSAAMLTALFYHDSDVKTAPAQTDVSYPASGAMFPSTSPRQALLSQERARMADFSRSLIYEGGYYPQEIYQLLGYENPGSARIARITRQLDRASDKKPEPWEVAGRVGRSGMSGVSDHWTMNPGENGGGGYSTPGTLAYLPALAVVYAAYPDDGREAAAQLAILKDDDLRAASVAKAAFSLLVRILASKTHDKDEWLREASKDCQDSDTEHDLRSVRVKDWKYLRGEECALGRLERAIYLWYKGDSYRQIMELGREQLRSRESLAFLASLASATYGMDSLPNRIVTAGASDRKLLELVNDLYDLSTSEAVLRVALEVDF